MQRQPQFKEEEIEITNDETVQDDVEDADFVDITKELDGHPYPIGAVSKIKLTPIVTQEPKILQLLAAEGKFKTARTIYSDIMYNLINERAYRKNATVFNISETMDIAGQVYWVALQQAIDIITETGPELNSNALNEIKKLQTLGIRPK